MAFENITLTQVAAFIAFVVALYGGVKYLKKELKDALSEMLKEEFESVDQKLDADPEFMKDMFDTCYEFNCDISSWDISKAKDISFMFFECEKFNQDLSKWDISNVQVMSNIFYRCSSLDKDFSSMVKPSSLNSKNKSTFFKNMFKHTKLKDDMIPDWAK